VAVREIRLLGDEVLRRKAVEVEAFDDALRTLVSDMYETMYHADGIGLAAPQIGVSQRVLVLDIREPEAPLGGRMAFVNPEIVSASTRTDRAPEGCLSIPGLEEVVTRPAEVTVRGFDERGEFYEVEADGLLARALQHEIDHLDGILFLDRVSPLKRRMLMKKWKRSREEARSQ